MESVAFIQWCLEHLNYWTITLLMTIESSFIPFPSEVIIPPAAYKAAVNDELNIYLVVLFATIGADIGALINYYLAKWLGRPIIYKFANSRIGHMCLIDEAKVQHAESYFDKHGALYAKSVQSAAKRNGRSRELSSLVGFGAKPQRPPFPVSLVPSASPRHIYFSIGSRPKGVSVCAFNRFNSFKKNDPQKT